MGKKSAKSKGYRKTYAKRPYLTKNEIIAAIAIAAAIVLAIVLFTVFYNDGSLKVKDGVVQVSGENSLIANAGTTEQPRYFKVGQTSEVEGYTMTSEPMSTDANVTVYTYTANEASAVDEAGMSAFAFDAKVYMESLQAAYADSTSFECSELLTTEIDGHAVYYIVYNALPEVVKESQAQAVENAALEGDVSEDILAQTTENTLQYGQALTACVTMHEDRCTVISLRNDCESDADYVEPAALEEVLPRFLAALSYETE